MTDKITRTQRPSGPTARKEDVDFLKWLMVGVVLVLGLAFGGMLTNYLAEKKTSYTDLRDEVKAQNQKIDNLTQELQRLKAIEK